MTGEILKLDDFLSRYGIHNEYTGGIACIRLNSRMLNQCELADSYVDAYSVMIPTRGSFSVTVNYMEYLVKPGLSLTLAPHLIISHVTHSANFEALQLFVERGLFETLIARDGQIARMDLLNKARPVVRLTRSQQESMTQLLSYIVRVIGEPHAHKDIIVPDLVHIAQFCVLENIQGDDGQGTGVKLRDYRHTDKLFSRFVYLAVDHFRTEHKIGYYASRLNISEAYLSRIVRQSSRQSVKEYLASLLFTEAFRLLRTTDRTISDIARELSFTDLSAFGKFFKSRSGMSPQTYRKQIETMRNGITHAMADDLQVITAIENACFPVAEAATENSFRERLRHFADCFWLYWDEGELKGFVDGLLSDAPDLTDAMYDTPGLHTRDGRWLMILGVCTAPAHQHQGIASRLLRQVVRDMRQQGRRGIVLTCKQALIPFYEQFGFRCEGVSQSVHGDAVWYQMRLTL